MVGEVGGEGGLPSPPRSETFLSSPHPEIDFTWECENEGANEADIRYAYPLPPLTAVWVNTCRRGLGINFHKNPGRRHMLGLLRLIAKLFAVRAN